MRSEDRMIRTKGMRDEKETTRSFVTSPTYHPTTTHNPTLSHPFIPHYSRYTA